MSAASEAKYPTTSRSSEMGEDFDFDNHQEMQQRYPRLWARFF
jgi:hypothetical protein